MLSCLCAIPVALQWYLLLYHMPTGRIKVWMRTHESTRSSVCIEDSPSHKPRIPSASRTSSAFFSHAQSCINKRAREGRSKKRFKPGYESQASAVRVGGSCHGGVLQCGRVPPLKLIQSLRVFLAPRTGGPRASLESGTLMLQGRQPQAQCSGEIRRLIVPARCSSAASCQRRPAHRRRCGLSRRWLRQSLSALSRSTSAAAPTAACRMLALFGYRQPTC